MFTLRSWTGTISSQQYGNFFPGLTVSNEVFPFYDNLKWYLVSFTNRYGGLSFKVLMIMRNIDECLTILTENITYSDSSMVFTLQTKLVGFLIEIKGDHEKLKLSGLIAIDPSLSLSFQYVFEVWKGSILAIISLFVEV